MTTMAEYQAIPALSAGGAWILSELCPALYWAQSPFNPDALPGKNSKEFDIGTAAHLAVLQPDLYAERTCHIPFDDYRTSQARYLRSEAYLQGRTPLKQGEVKIVDGVRDAIQKRPDVARLFTGGAAEVTRQWYADGVSCKGRADYLYATCITDLKTVTCAHERAAAAAAIRDGWHLRAVWYMEGYRTSPALKYFFVCVEKSPPHVIEVYELDERAVAWGEHIMRRALRLFKLCHENNHWPGYDGTIPVKLSLPTWSEYQLADREQNKEFSEDAIMFGNRFLAP